jgi:DNA-binding FadR family transcriptional regulator
VLGGVLICRSQRSPLTAISGQAEQRRSDPIFASLSESLFAWLAEFHFALVRKPGLEQLTLAEHRQMLGAIERGKPDEAARLTADHLNRANALYNLANFRA